MENGGNSGEQNGNNNHHLHKKTPQSTHQPPTHPPSPIPAPQPPFQLTSPSSPPNPPPSKSDFPPSLSTLSEKRLRLARSLHLLQSDIRLAREGIESLESRLEQISLASTARTIDSDRALTLRRQRGDPPPQLVFPPAQAQGEWREGTYVWLPWTRG